MAEKWAVTCRIGDDINHRTTFKEQAAAERHKKLVDDGGHCTLEHVVEKISA